MFSRFISGKSISTHLGIVVFVLFSALSLMLLFEFYSKSFESAHQKQIEMIEQKETIISLLVEKEEARVKNIINSYTSKVSIAKNESTLLFEEGQENLDLFFIRSATNNAIINLSFSIYDSDELIEKVIENNRKTGLQFVYQYLDNTYYSILLYSKEIIDPVTGRVTGYVYGGTIFNNNIEFLEALNERLESSFVMLSIFSKEIGFVGEKVSENIGKFIGSDKKISHSNGYILGKSEIYEYENIPLSVIYGLEDTIHPKVERDFLELSIYIVTSIFFSIVIMYLFAKGMILAPLRKLVDLFKDFNNKEHIVASKDFGVKEFNLIKQSLIELIEGIDESRNLVAQILEGAPIAIYYKDKDLYFKDLNKSFLGAFRFENRNEIIGKKAEEIFTESSSLQLLEQDEIALAVPHKIHSFHSDEISRDGKHFLNLLIYKKALLDTNGEVAGIIGVMLDISEEKRLQKDLQRSQNDLMVLNQSLETRVRKEVATKLQVDKKRQKEHDLILMQSKIASTEEMLDSIAHHWKQPISTLELLLEKIKKTYEENNLDTETLETLISSSKKQVGYMSKTIDDFRGFLKPQKKKRDFLLKKAIEDALVIIDNQLFKANIEVRIIGDLRVIIGGKESEFKQVAINIISSMKDGFIKKHNSKNSIEIEILQQEENTIIYFRDNAGGVDENLLPDKLFELYEGSIEQKSAGMRLYVAKLIIEDRFLGAIMARNRDDGTEFIITI